MKKKVLKIIQIVYDILSLGFIIFVVCAMSFTPKREIHSNNDVNDVVEVKIRDNYFNRFGYLHWSPEEILTDNRFYERFSDAFYNMQVNGSYSLIYAVTDLRYQDTWYSFNVDNTSNVYDNATQVYSLTFTLVQAGYWQGAYYQNWHFNVNTDYDNYYVVELGYYINSNHPSPSYDNLIFNAVRTSNSNFAFQFIIPNRQGTFWYNYFIDNSDYQDGYDSGYQYGYDEGYDEGVDRGLEVARDPVSDTYQYIFDLGKQEGLIEGMRGTESNAFVVIGQAFGAVGSVLSIEVMPNLPLWVLVFTPLIIAVVIVVVKLIKG